MKKTKIDLDILLPEIVDERDACIGRLTHTLKAFKGIDKVHLKPAGKTRQAQLCFHYNSDRISLSQVEKLAKNEGAEITAHYGHLLIRVTGIRHPRHARQLERELSAKPGVLEASVAGTGIIRLEYNKTETDVHQLRIWLKKKGLVIQKDMKKATEREPAAHQQQHKEAEKHEHKHSGWFGPNSELVFSLLCGTLFGLGFGLGFVDGLSQWIPRVLFFGAYFFGAYYVAIEAYEAISNGMFEIDFLMLVAAAGAGILGQWEEGALLLFLFSLGHALEHYAMEKARKSIEVLADLAPKTALRKENEKVLEVLIEELKIDDIIIIRPNTKIAADGVVVKGTSSVNQAPITGESIPVDKVAWEDGELNKQAMETVDARYRVFSGSINGNGTLEVRVNRMAKDSTIARVIDMVNEAQTQKSPTQQFTDRFEKYFVPIVLVLVFILCFAFLVIDEPFKQSFYRAMSVLVAASPCALAISTPSAVLSGVARAARSGVLVKGGRPLEDLGSLTALAFDKTGTLTTGKPRLTTVKAEEGITEDELLKIAIAVEALSNHPLAKAIVQDGKTRLRNTSIPQAENLEALLGKGVQAMLDGQKIYIGNLPLFEQLDAVQPTEALVSSVKTLEKKGNTTMLLRRENHYLGLIALMDTPRPEAKETLSALKHMGIQRMIMLTGDNQQVADAIGQELGLTDTWGGLLPEEKVNAIKRLQQEENKVAMVGDGVNDAPAMANSTVGIAMGAAGSDVALETADIALMGDKLSLLPFAIGLSRQTKRIIRQNLWISLGMVAILIPLTIAGIASIGPAVIAHEGSTLVVVFNALRLLAFSAKPTA